jgi:hypothetical protein
MNEEQQRIAIAEACGFINVRMWSESCIASVGMNAEGKYWGSLSVPDYLHDLNAMHDAEKTLDFEQSELFEDELCDVTFKDNDGLENPLPCRFSVCHATAAQRAEAFLKTIGKWEGGSDE